MVDTGGHLPRWVKDTGVLDYPGDGLAVNYTNELVGLSNDAAVRWTDLVGSVVSIRQGDHAGQRGLVAVVVKTDSRHSRRGTIITVILGDDDTVDLSWDDVAVCLGADFLRLHRGLGQRLVDNGFRFGSLHQDRRHKQPIDKQVSVGVV